MQENQISTKRGFPVYRTHPSVPPKNGLPRRTKRINVPGGKGSVFVDSIAKHLQIFPKSSARSIAASAVRVAAEITATDTVCAQQNRQQSCGSNQQNAAVTGSNLLGSNITFTHLLPDYNPVTINGSAGNCHASQRLT